MAFHVVVNGQQQGPFDMNTLKQMVNSKQLTKETLVWKAGYASWIAASQAPELASVFASVPPPPPPPPPAPPQ